MRLGQRDRPAARRSVRMNELRKPGTALASPEDTMTHMTQRDLGRTAALLLFSIFVASGCGSATSPRVTSSRTALHDGSSTATVVAWSTQRSQGVSRARRRRSGITGEAVASECAVTRAGEQTCPSHPVRAVIEALRVSSGDRTATVHTDRAGHFRLSVAPGAYQLLSRSSDHRLYARPVALHVRAHHFERVRIRFFPRHPLPAAPGPNECKACPPPPP
jgi:hypothetical protein